MHQMIIMLDYFVEVVDHCMGRHKLPPSERRHKDNDRSKTRKFKSCPNARLGAQSWWNFRDAAKFCDTLSMYSVKIHLNLIRGT